MYTYKPVRSLRSCMCMCMRVLGLMIASVLICCAYDCECSDPCGNLATVEHAHSWRLDRESESRRSPAVLLLIAPSKLESQWSART